MSEISVKASYGISKLANSISMLGAEDYMRAYMRDMVMNGQWQNADFYQEYKDQIWNTDPSRFQFYPDLCLQNGTKQNYEVSYRGGTEKIQNSTVLSFMNEDGIAVNTGFKRFYFQTNNSIKLLPQLILNTNISYEHNIRSGAFWTEGNIFNEIQTFSPLVPKEWTFQEIDDNLYYTGKMDNPYRKLKDIDYSNKNHTFFGQAELVYNITDNWFVKAGMGVRTPKGEIKEFVPKTIQRGYDNNGWASYGTQNALNLRGVVQAGFNKVFNEVHNLSVNAVYEANTNKYETFGQEYSQFNTDLGWEGIYDAKSGNHVKSPTVGYEKVAMLSGVFMANYSYKGRYLLKASMRADGSSKFSPDNRWGFFPSGAIGWRVSDENFFKNVSWLKKNVDNLKLRFSYGATGNQSIDPYTTFSMYGQGSGEISYADGTGNKTTAMVVTNLSNSSLKWEKTSSWNVGLDFGLFNSHLSGTLDIYQKKTTDLLISRNLPGSAGFSSTYYNQGSLNNKGVEFSLNAQVIDSSSWKWSVSGNIGVNRNEISDLGLLPADFGCLGERVGYYGNSLGDHFGVGHIFLAGEAPGLFYGYVTQGIVQKEDITENGIKYIKQDGSVGYYQTVNKTTPVAGDVKYVDRNGDGVVDDNDRDIIGNPNPDFTYGFQTKVSWKSLSLSASFNGVQGRDILNVGNRYNNTPGTKSNNVTRKAFQNMWTDENPSNLYPKSTFVVQNMVMDRYVEDGSYLRCSDITLSYILPAKWTNKIGIKNTSVYASVKNAFVITDYSGYDPEVNSFAFDGLRPGVDMNSYPTPRSFVFGLNLTF